MTADGTYPSPRAGKWVSTADYLSELADRARVMGDDGWGPLQPKQWRFFADWLGSLIEAGEPNGVLFRPDAPQPATGDAVERAARAVAEEMTHDTDYDPAYDYTEDSRRYARAALAAARAGEAEVRHQAACSLGLSTRSCDCGAAQRGGEPVNREALAPRDLVPAVCPVHGIPDCSPLLNGCSIPRYMVGYAEDVLAARGDAATPTVTAEQDRLDRASAWSDYRSEYGVHGAQSHRDFCAGWDAARGTLDIGGVQR